MASEKNVKIVGRDRNGTPRQALVDETSATVCSNNNVGREFGMAYNTGTGSHLVLTTDNNNIGFATSGLVPLWGTARDMAIVTNTAGLIVTLKCYCIDLNGDEKIIYVTTNGTTPVTTGTTSPSGTGGTSVSLTTQLRHINFIEDIVPRSSGIVYVRTTIGGLVTTLILQGHYYQINPIYCCPTGRRAIVKGFVRVDTNAQNDYAFVVFKKPANPSIAGGHPISFPFRFRINNTATNANSYQWSENGLVTVDENEWLFLNRESGTSQTTCGLVSICVEYKV